MLLWREPCAFRKSKSCCGMSPAHFGKANVAVVQALCISEKRMLLWHEPCAFRKSKSCCGMSPAHFGKTNLAVVWALRISQN
jgi:hypothetical protein